MNNECLALALAISTLLPRSAIHILKVLLDHKKTLESNTQNGYFSLSIRELKEKVPYSETHISTILQRLRTLNLLDIERRGLPSKNFYRVHTRKILQLLSDKQKLNTSDKQKSSFDYTYYITYNTRNTRNTRNINDINNIKSNTILEKEKNVLDADTNVSASSFLLENNTQERSMKREVSDKERSLREDIRLVILEALEKGGFKNRPPVIDKPVAKLYLEVQKFLSLVTRPDLFIRTYEFDERWLREEGIDLYYCKNRAIEPLVRRAVSRLAKMRLPEYAPKSKRTLPRYIQDFFYNPAEKKSWFLYCLFHAPQEVETEEKLLEAFDERSRDYVLRYWKAEWSRTGYLRKMLKLYTWYKKYYDKLVLYNRYAGLSYVSLSHWYTYFDHFTAFLDRLDEFSKSWQGWSLANIGVDTKTWPHFVKWCETRYRIKLELTDEDIQKAEFLKDIYDKRERQRLADRDEEKEKADAALVEKNREMYRQYYLQQLEEINAAPDDDDPEPEVVDDRPPERITAWRLEQFEAEAAREHAELFEEFYSEVDKENREMFSQFYEDVQREQNELLDDLDDDEE